MMQLRPSNKPNLMMSSTGWTRYLLLKGRLKASKGLAGLEMLTDRKNPRRNLIRLIKIKRIYLDHRVSYPSSCRSMRAI